MNTSVETNNIRKVLFFADGARGQMAALRRAAGIAIHNGADLTVIGVVNEVSTNDARLRRNMQSIQKTLIRDRGLELDQLIADIGPLKGRKLSVRRQVAVGKDTVAVIQAVVEGRFDLLVKSVRSVSPLGSLFSDVDTRLLHYCPCPVMILKPQRRKTWRSVLVAVDPHADSAVAEALNSSLLETGSRVAARENAALHVLHVLQHPLEDEKSVLKEEYRLIDRTLREHAASSMDKMLDQHKAREEDRHRMVPLDQHLVKGKPHTAIARFVKENDIDLLVMGSVARSGIPGFFVGNTAEKILDNVDCSVLVLKPEGWTTPVS